MMPKKPLSATDIEKGIELNTLKNFQFKSRNYEFTPKQKELIGKILDPRIKIIFVEGPAGTSKTVTSMYGSLKLIQDDPSTHSLLYLRSAIESASRNLGYMPGAQPYECKIATPDGWTTMGEICSGDIVYAHDGSPVKVIDVFEHGERDIYEITTSNGQKTLACDKHLWEIQERTAKNKFRKSPKLANTLYLKDNLLNKYGKFQCALPNPAPLEYSKQVFKIHPYLMGSLLGDGCFSNNSIYFCSADQDIFEKNLDICRDSNFHTYEQQQKGKVRIVNISQNLIKTNKPSRPVQITNLQTNENYCYPSIGIAYKNLPVEFSNITKPTLRYWCEQNQIKHEYDFKFNGLAPYSNCQLRTQLHDYKLLNKRAHEKHIPQIYKFGSIDQRLELLRGLLDTDGTIKKNGGISFTTTSKQLAQDVKEVVQSLGGKAFIYTRDRRKKITTFEERTIQTQRISYEVVISISNCPFYCQRKVDRFNQNVSRNSIFITNVKKIKRDNVKCILIDHPSHLYITDDFIVTHNTYEDKKNHYMLPLIDKLDELLYENDVQFLLDGGMIESGMLNFIRGADWKNQIIILDEAQNCTIKELQTVMTRISENSKLIVTGDCMQSDMNKSGLREVKALFSDQEALDNGIHSIQFNAKDIVRSEIVKFVVEKFHQLY